MERVARGVRRQSLRLGGIACVLLILLGGCSGPRHFGRASAMPVPMQQGRGTAPRAYSALRAIRPASPLLPPLHADETQEGAPWSGLQLAMQGSGQGILVGRVSTGSPAEVAGIQPGDFIFQLDGRSVIDALDVLAEVERVGVGGSLRLGVHRAERVRLFRVEPVAKPSPLRVEASEPELPPSATLEGAPERSRDPAN